MSFIEQMIRSLDEAGDRPLLIEVQGKRLREVSGAGLAELVKSARGLLTERRIRPGDRVALIAHNSVRWAAANLAILGAGAISVPMYERQAPRELAGMLDDADVALVLVDTPKLKSELEEVWRAEGRVVLFDQVFAHPPGPSAPVARAPSDRVTMIYTSGTSGEPKGVLYTRENVDFMLARTIDSLRVMVGDRPGPDRVFHYLPFCFAGSRVQLWSQLMRGNPLMISSDLNNLVEEIGTAQPHYFLNVPTLLERIRLGVSNKLKERGGVAFALYQRALSAAERVGAGRASLADRAALLLGQQLVFRQIRQQIGTNLEFLICGSAPLSEDTQRWFQTIGIPAYQVYGLTETTAIVTMDQKGLARPGYVGRPIEGVELKITDEGELIVRGPNIFPEYWKRADATQNSIRDGWFHTGDMAELTAERELKIVGRLKDLLVPESGHNVAPGPLEEKLASLCPGAQVMLVGHARPYLSAIVTGPLAEGEVQRAIDALNGELPHYRRVRKFVIASEPFSVENGLLTANQKLKRNAVERRYAKQIEELFRVIELRLSEGIYELELRAPPLNEIGPDMLAALERTLDRIDPEQGRALIIYSGQERGFCAGADLRGLYAGILATQTRSCASSARDFIDRIHVVMNRLDALPLTTIGAIHGVCFGGGFELALTCDVLVADKSARFCFPELRLGLVPGFGGVPRLKREVGNAVVRDLLLTGRSLNAKRAHELGLVSQMVAQGKQLDAARATARQALRFNRDAAETCKVFVKPIPYSELELEKQHFKRLVMRPVVEQALKKFVESSDLRPYLP